MSGSTSIIGAAIFDGWGTASAAGRATKLVFLVLCFFEVCFGSTLGCYNAGCTGFFNMLPGWISIVSPPILLCVWCDVVLGGRDPTLLLYMVYSFALTLGLPEVGRLCSISDSPSS